jgi:putative hemolysin
MLDPGLALVSLLSLLLLSGFFSGSETALMAANRYRLAHLARQGDTRAQKVRKLLRNKERVLSTILLGNLFSHLAASALATTVAIGLAGDEGAIYATIVMTVLVLIFAEIAPKNFAARHPERVAFAVTTPISILVKILHPLASSAVVVANGALMVLGKPIPATPPISEEDIKGIISLGEEEVAIAREKRRMLRGVFRLGDLSIEDVMIPRPKVVPVDVEANPSEIIETIQSSGFTRFPVCRGTLDNVIGVLNSKDVFRYSENLDELCIESMTRKPMFVPESAPLQVVLQAFQQERQHLAMVIDEYGGVEGIVSLEDVLEEIVGEIDDEFDEPFIPPVTELPDGSLRVAGSCPLALLNQRYKLNLASEESTTLAGIILELSGKIPRVGESVASQNLNFIIEIALPHRVDQVRVVRSNSSNAQSR